MELIFDEVCESKTLHQVRRDGQTLDVRAIVKSEFLLQLWPVTTGGLILGQLRRKRPIFMKGRDGVLMVFYVNIYLT